ncbi:desulfoferrodoxin family protein [bacterium]
MEFGGLIKKGSEEGKEKHVPFINVTACSTCNEVSVVIKVGETVLHPHTPEHHIQFIDLFGLDETGKLVFLTRFVLGGENTVPYVKTHVVKGKFKSLIALSMCNVHGMWENAIAVTV